MPELALQEEGVRIDNEANRPEGGERHKPGQHLLQQSPGCQEGRLESRREVGAVALATCPSKRLPTQQTAAPRRTGKCLNVPLNAFTPRLG